MPRNGVGVFSLVALNPVVTNTVVSSVWANNSFNDFALAFTQSLAYDGQTTPVANLPMGTFRHTAVGNAVARTCYASASDVQDGTLTSLTSVSGTDTIVGVAAFAMVAYVTGQKFTFTALNTNTATVTININSIGAKAITKSGATGLSAGDIVAGGAYEIVYDGTRFQLIGARPPASVVVVLQTFTGTGTYTPTAGMSYCIVHMVGGGAGGATMASGNYGGGGGGTGEYATGVFTAAQIGANKAVTIGAAGAANGGAGGTTSLGTLLTAVGGAANAASATGGAGGTGGTGTGLHCPGGYGGAGALAAASGVVGGDGGASWFGSGGYGGQGNLSNGAAGTAYGSGGGGNGNSSSIWSVGGIGAAGVVLIYEYL